MVKDSYTRNIVGLRRDRIGSSIQRCWSWYREFWPRLIIGATRSLVVLQPILAFAAPGFRYSGLGRGRDSWVNRLLRMLIDASVTGSRGLCAFGFGQWRWGPRGRHDSFSLSSAHRLPFGSSFERTVPEVAAIDAALAPGCWCHFPIWAV